MSQIERLREQIDACRPGSDDLALPGLAELAAAAEKDRAVTEELARSQQFDKAVAAAMHDAPVPVGLLDRLLATVDASPARLLPSEEIAVVEQTRVDVRPAESRVPHRSARRRWLALAASLAVVTLVGVSIYEFWSRKPPLVAQGELSQSVGRWFDEVLGKQYTKSWSPASSSRLPAAYPIPLAVTANPVRWTPFRTVGNGWSGNGIAIDLAPSTSPRAILFVVAPTARFQISPAPNTGHLTLTGTLKATAWQNPNSNLLYVLVVDERGGQQRLDQFLRVVPAA